MADKIKDDPGGDSLRFTFKVVDESSAALRELEKQFGHSARAINSLAETLKPALTGLQSATTSLGTALAASAEHLEKHAAYVDHTVSRSAASLNELENQHKRVYKSFETQPIPKIVGTQEWIDQQVRLTHEAANRLMAEHDIARAHTDKIAKEYIEKNKKVTDATLEFEKNLKAHEARKRTTSEPESEARLETGLPVRSASMFRWGRAAAESSIR
jgi:hypothetical protein